MSARNKIEVLLVETHGDADEVIARWTPKQRIVVTRDKVQVDGAIVALYEDLHYYPTIDPRNPALDDENLSEECGNEVWIELGGEREASSDED